MEKKRHSLGRQGSCFWKSVRDGDFQEEDVWDVLDDEDKDCNNIIAQQITRPSFSDQRSLLSAAKMIPRITTGESNSPRQGKEVLGVRQNSAPVNIPDWSQIQVKRSKKTRNHDDDDDDDDVEIDDYNDEDGSDDDVAPHEYFLARSRSSSSECGGRTLKGRDLRRVRNAVLKQTGFLE